jgi:PIN domain nuclease of toxin-antitoxin system
VILLDTHALIWLIGDDRKLSLRARAAIEKEYLLQHPIAISDATLYELAWLVARNRIETKTSLDRYLEEVQARFLAKRITPAIAAAAARFPKEYPGDPIDRIIAATAVVEGLELVTADSPMRTSNVVSTIW